jgi:NADPH-dependent 7-cyano-7-deazaguanine reductase QueF
MEIIHKTSMQAKCPNGGHVNKYEITIKVPSFVEVEKLLEIVKTYKETEIFQEDLTKEVAQEIHKLFKATESVGIIMEGIHLGFMTTTIYEYPETKYNV